MNVKIKVGIILTFIIVVTAVLYWKPSTPEFTTSTSDVVDTKNGIGSIERFYTFIKNIDSGKSDSISLKTYGKEGQPTITDMRYDGKLIYANIDSTIGILWSTKRTKTKGTYTKIQKIGNDYYLVDESGKCKDEYLYQDKY